MYHCLRSLGDLYRMKGQFARAAAKYSEAIDLARTMRSTDLVADARIGLGLTFRALGQWKKAGELIRTSRSHYAKRGDREGIAFALWAEAGTLRIKGDVPGALKTFRSARRLFQSLGDREGVAYCLCGLGGASRVAGHSRASLRYYRAAEGMFSDLRDTFGRAYSFCGIANAHRMLGEYRKAFSFFGKATRLYRRLGDSVSYAYTLWGRATAHKMIGEYKEARIHLKNAMRLFRKTNDPRGLAYCTLGLSEIAGLTGKRATAGKYVGAAWKTVVDLDLSLEKCHTATVAELLAKQDFNGSRWFGDELKSGALSTASARGCYRRLGLNLRYRSLPLNIP